MRPCPTCNYLLNPSDQNCRFCGTNLRAADLAAEAAARQAAEIAAATPPPSALSTSVFAAIGIGIVIIALVGWVTFRGGDDQPAAASARSHSTTTAVTEPAAPTTTMAAPTPLPTTAPGFTLFGIPNASANLELPTGAQVGSIEDGDFVRAELGGGTGLGIGSVDELPLGGTAASLLTYMQHEKSVSVGSYDDILSGLKIVPNLAGPAVSFDYHLDDGVWGHGTMVLIGRILVMVQLVGTPGTTFTPAQLDTYNHAVSSITGVL